ncbi:MAG: histidinol-phosphate transaminase [Nitrospinota bacterium]
MGERVRADEEWARGLLRKGVAELTPYKGGQSAEQVRAAYGLDRVVKLASNENPFGPAPRAVEAIRAALDELHRYPDGNASRLKEALAPRLGCSPEELFIGNGGDDVLSVLARTVVDVGDECLIPSPSFSPYEVVTRVMGGVPVFSPLREFRVDLEGYRRRLSPRTKLIFLCNPNNPTGTIVGEPAFGAFVREVPSRSLLLVDEAYGDFAEDPSFPDTLSYLAEGRAVFILRTFSKIFGLAGLRVGFGVGPAPLVRHMHRTKEPFNVNLLAQAAALAALEDEEYRRSVRGRVLAGRRQLCAGFERLGLDYVPSEANFIFVRVGAGRRMQEALLARGVVVRPGTAFGHPEHVRVTVGREEENELFLSALEAAL